MKKKRKVEEIVLTPDMLRQMHLIQLELLIEFDRICTKYDIKYSIDGGTLLGAVRHKGFIPWDDDIDIIIMRDEYEKFFKVCQQELDKDKFFLQEHRTDPWYRVAYTRLRRNNTVYIRAGQEHMKHRTGVLIDIFVMDNVPNSKIMQYIHQALCFFFRKILWSATGKIVSKNPLERAIYWILSIIPAKFAFWGFNSLARICNKRKSKFVKHYAMPYPRPSLNITGIPADLMNDFTRLEFEGHMFMAVADYDRYLRMLYGNYMELPPPEKRKPRIHLSAFAPITEQADKNKSI